MTVATSTSSNSYAGNGSLTSFAYAFKIFADSDLLVTLVTDATGAEVTQTLTTDYTVTGAGSDSGGNVVLGTAPASGVTVVIRRVLPLTQTTNYVPNDPFPAEAHEDALDKVTMLAQQNSVDNERSIIIPEGEVDAGTVRVLPSAVSRANKYLFFDAGGGVTTADSTSGQTGACILLDEYNYSQTDPSIDRVKLENFNNSAYHSYKIVIDSLEAASSGYLFVQFGFESGGSILYTNSGYMYASDYRNVTTLNVLSSGTIHDNDHHSIQFQNGPIDGFTSGEFSLHQGVSGVSRRPFFTGNSMTIDKASSDAYDINHVWGARNLGASLQIAGVQFYFSLTTISSPILIGGGSARLYGFTKA